MSTPNTKLPLSRPRLAARIAGTIVLLACLVMVIGGTTRWSSHLQGRAFIVYWSWCFLLAVAAILLALVDLLLLQQTYRQNRRALFEREFMTKDFMKRARLHPEEKIKE